MSGGHYNYLYSQINMLADDIEVDFLKDGDYEDEWEKIVKNHLDDDDLTPQQKEKLLKQIKNFIQELRNVSQKARDLEWMMSSDISPEDLYNLWNDK